MFSISCSIGNCLRLSWNIELIDVIPDSVFEWKDILMTKRNTAWIIWLRCKNWQCDCIKMKLNCIDERFCCILNDCHWFLIHWNRIFGTREQDLMNSCLNLRFFKHNWTLEFRIEHFIPALECWHGISTPKSSFYGLVSRIPCNWTN